jgi:hypothetical protein
MGFGGPWLDRLVEAPLPQGRDLLLEPYQVVWLQSAPIES